MKKVFVSLIVLLSCAQESISTTSDILILIRFLEEKQIRGLYIIPCLLTLLVSLAALFMISYCRRRNKSYLESLLMNNEGGQEIPFNDEKVAEDFIIARMNGELYQESDITLQGISES